MLIASNALQTRDHSTCLFVLKSPRGFYSVELTTVKSTCSSYEGLSGLYISIVLLRKEGFHGTRIAPAACRVYVDDSIVHRKKACKYCMHTDDFERL